MHWDLINWAESERQTVLRAKAARVADLPLRFLCQQAHYTTPASIYKLAEGAASRGFMATTKILTKLNITLEDVAKTLDAPLSAIEDLLNRDPHAPTGRYHLWHR